MSAPDWHIWSVDDPYIKSAKIIRYLQQNFGPGNYQVSSKSDTYIVMTKTKLSQKQKDDIYALSARYSVISSNLKNASPTNDSDELSPQVPAPAEQTTKVVPKASETSDPPPPEQILPKRPTFGQASRKLTQTLAEAVTQTVNQTAAGRFSWFTKKPVKNNMRADRK